MKLVERLRKAATSKLSEQRKSDIAAAKVIIAPITEEFLINHASKGKMWYCLVANQPLRILNEMRDLLRKRFPDLVVETHSAGVLISWDEDLCIS